VCLRSFGRRMRSLIPETRLHKAPPKGWSNRRDPAQTAAEQEFEFTARNSLLRKLHSQSFERG